ncbi:MAG: hypothetical protein WD360_02760 [Nitriliruptoraceae bacterium]
MIKRLHRLFAAVLVAAGVVVLPSTPAQADLSSCAGVLVVVDASAAGGDVTVRCAAGTPRTGLDALTAAGFDYTFVPRIPGMVCQIDNRPDPCNNAPANAYWSYWHRDAQGSWRYATEGAGTYRPAAGDTEGWVFGEGDQPPKMEITPTRDEPSSTTDDNKAPSATPPADTSTSTENPLKVDREEPSDDVTALEDSDYPASAEAASPANSDSDSADGAATTARFIDRFVEEPRQLVGLLLVVIGVVALISAQRSRSQRPPQ